MIKVSMDSSSVGGFKMRIKEFTKGTGKSVQEAINILGKSCAKELAVMVPPYGISAKHGITFQKSIAKQVDRAIKAANVTGTPGSAESVHEKVRRRGQVRRDLVTQGQFKRDPISVREKMDLVNKKQKAAGTAKGAWIAAGEAIDGKKMTGISKWIRRHAKKNGYATIRPAGLSTTIFLENRLPFINSLQPQGVIGAALKRGYARNFRYMTIVVKKIRGEI